MDEFDQYFEKASRQSHPHTTHYTSQTSSSHKKNLQNESNKKEKSKDEDIYNSKRSRSIHQPHQEHHPPICLITPEDEVETIPANKEPSFYQKLSKKRNSKDSQKDSLRVSLLEGPVRRHSINPEEITASKLQQIDQLQQDDCLIVRSFLTSPKGLVDRGDSFKRRASNVGDRLPTAAQMLELSNSFKRRLSDVSKNNRNSFHGSTNAATISDLINANASATSENEDSICLELIEKRSDRHGKRTSLEAKKGHSLDSNSHPQDPENIRSLPKPVVKRTLSRELANVVLVLGDSKVGKSSLITQFLSSEHLMGYENYSASSFENIISIYVDGVETQLNFIEVDAKSCKTLEQLPKKSECKAFLVVYSITDSASFHTATKVSKSLCLAEETGKKGQVVLGKRSYSVILVANKGDLVRNRKVSEAEAREVCNRYECKYIEVSSALSHNVNELLVGLVQQIKLNDKRKSCEGKLLKGVVDKASSFSCSSSTNLLSNNSSSPNSYLKWFKKIFAFKNKEDNFQCDNMYTL